MVELSRVLEQSFYFALMEKATEMLTFRAGRHEMRWQGRDAFLPQNPLRLLVSFSLFSIRKKPQFLWPSAAKDLKVKWKERDGFTFIYLCLMCGLQGHVCLSADILFLRPLNAEQDPLDSGEGTSISDKTVSPARFRKQPGGGSYGEHHCLH